MNSILHEREDVDVISATQGSSGFELARAIHPDLILLDIGLPDMNGFELLKRLKDRAETSDIPVVAVTASAIPGDMEKGIEAGFTDYITKPVDAPKILGMVDSALKGD